MAIEESKTRLAVEGPQMLPAVEGAEIRMSVEGAEIRMAEGEDDLAAVAAIHSASWQDAYQGVIPSAILASKTSQSLLPGWRATLAAHPGNLRVLVEGGRILGFCCAGSVGDPKKSAPADFEIFGLHVHPGHRRKGLGRRLLKDALARARGPAIVWTLEDLSLSRRFYEREGGIEHSRAVWRCGGFGFREISYLWA